MNFPSLCNNSETTYVFSSHFSSVYLPAYSENQNNNGLQISFENIDLGTLSNISRYFSQWNSSENLPVETWKELHIRTWLHSGSVAENMFCNFSRPLFTLFTKYISLGEFPMKWKTAFITPIYLRKVIDRT